MIETERLQIRTFTLGDLPDIHRILDLTFGDGSKIEDETAVAHRQS